MHNSQGSSSSSSSRNKTAPRQEDLRAAAEALRDHQVLKMCGAQQQIECGLQQPRQQQQQQ
jgi:hypothetical protein